MLQIKRKQAEVFRRLLFEDFLGKMVLHIHEVFQEEVTETDDELLDKIDFWVKEAMKYGIDYESEVEKYIDLCYCFSELGEEPKNQKLVGILNNKETEQKIKIKNLENILLYDQDVDENELSEVNSQLDDIDSIV